MNLNGRNKRKVKKFMNFLIIKDINMLLKALMKWKKNNFISLHIYTHTYDTYIYIYTMHTYIHTYVYSV